MKVSTELLTYSDEITARYLHQGDLAVVTDCHHTGELVLAVGYGSDLRSIVSLGPNLRGDSWGPDCVLKVRRLTPGESVTLLVKELQ